jgi:hypothetical protein
MLINDRKRSGTVRNGQKRSETAMNGQKRSGTVNGQTVQDHGPKRLKITVTVWSRYGHASKSKETLYLIPRKLPNLFFERKKFFRYKFKSCLRFTAKVDKFESYPKSIFLLTMETKIYQKFY